MINSWRWSQANELIVPFTSMQSGDWDFKKYGITLVWSYFDHYKALEEVGWTPERIAEVRDAFLKEWQADNLLPLEFNDMNSILVLTASRERLPVVMREL